MAPADGGVRQVASGLAYGSGKRRTLDVYVPSTRSAKPRPVVVIFYGGSWNSGRRQDYAFLGKALASRGFVAIVADYRLVPEVRFPKFLEDGARAVAWAHANAASYGGDANALFVMGHSAGAYNAAMISLDPRYLKAAGLSQQNLAGTIALAGPYDFFPFKVESTKAAFGKAPDPSQTQPVNFVSPQDPPMFLATGADDTTVKPRNTRILASKLRAVGVGVDEHSYKDITHIGLLLALSVPYRDTAPVLDDLAAFIDARSHALSGVPTN